ncbi:hypothetical protein [Anaerolentibacter hominis]|uniref:hypothetical protein n=1 Tax=Anaerolentibacter hominis TaxID=3079009 RepID=UPI0031B87DDE
MKKVSYLLILSLILILTGCSKAATAPAPDHSASDSSDGSSSGSDMENTAADQGLRLIHAMNINYGAPSSSGFYHTLVNLNGEEGQHQYDNILYIDYETKQEIYLCNKPECSHDNESCTSYLEATMPGSFQLICQEPYLYLIYAQPDSFAETPQAPAVYRMNLDGSEKRKIVELNSSMFLTGSYALGNGLLYAAAVTTEVQENEADGFSVTADVKQELVELDLTQGTWRTLCSLENTTLEGVYEDKLIFTRMVYPKDPNSFVDNDAGYFDNLKNSTMEILTFSPGTAKEKVHKSFQYAEVENYAVDGSCVYYSGLTDTEINCLDLSSGTVKTCVKKLPKGSHTFSHITDGKLLINYYTGKNETYQSAGTYLADLSSGKSKPFTLLIGQYDTPAPVLGSYNDSYFIISDFIEKEEFIAWANVTQSSLTGYEYSLISKEDYFSSKANYTPLITLYPDGGEHGK